MDALSSLLRLARAGDPPPVPPPHPNDELNRLLMDKDIINPPRPASKPLDKIVTVPGTNRKTIGHRMGQAGAVPWGDGGLTPSPGSLSASIPVAQVAPPGATVTPGLIHPPEPTVQPGVTLAPPEQQGQKGPHLGTISGGLSTKMLLIPLSLPPTAPGKPPPAPPDPGVFVVGPTGSDKPLGRDRLTGLPSDVVMPRVSLEGIPRGSNPQSKTFHMTFPDVRIGETIEFAGSELSARLIPPSVGMETRTVLIKRVGPDLFQLNIHAEYQKVYPYKTSGFSLFNLPEEKQLLLSAAELPSFVTIAARLDNGPLLGLPALSGVIDDAVVRVALVNQEVRRMNATDLMAQLNTRPTQPATAKQDTSLGGPAALQSVFSSGGTPKDGPNLNSSFSKPPPPDAVMHERDGP